VQGSARYADSKSRLTETILAFLAGLLIGSFLNVCIFRLPRDLSVVSPRSFCPGCEAQIAAYDNIPLVSFVLLGGKCRHCKLGIPLRYPIVELATGVMFAWCVWYFGLTGVGVKLSIYSAIMITLIATDWEERILPDEFTLGGTVLGLVLAYFVPMPFEMGHLALPSALGERGLSVGESVIGAAVGSGMIWLLGWAYQKVRKREGLGLGDVKMIACIGAFTGLSLTLMTMVFASVLGTVLGGAYVLIAKKKAATFELPFGSFLGIAALAVAIYGQIVLGSINR
jgi:leader peptidase (prepilin peptidase) / N-methyltransferase